ncbi:MAG: hypothetical protein H7Z11_11850 [Verrucomicrobia bacterium]|nr:hypothetical protein [Leptolyngbya sp. ES-bin-22]
MLRTSYYLTALIAALTTLVAVLAHSQPLPTFTNRITPQTVSEPLPNAVVPVCYIQLENGQLRDLGRLCGRKATSPTSSRGVQRSILQPNPDSDDDDSTATATPKPQTTPAQASPASTSPQPTATAPASTSSPQPTSIKTTPQPATSPPSNVPSRPASAQPPATPSPSAPSPPNPLAIPQDRD